MTDLGAAPEVADTDRLEAVRATGLLDSGPEESFDRLGSLARRVLGAPMALVTIVDADRQHFKCCQGLPEPYASVGETPLSHSICQFALAGAEPLVISDARKDSRLVANRAVEELNAIAYLGIPLVGRTGHVLGSFCVLDDRPREWTGDDVLIMVDLAASVMSEIELRELTRERSQAATAVAESESRLRSIIDSLFIFVGLLSPDGAVLDANNAALDAAGLTLDEVVGRPFWDTYWWSWEESTQEQLRRAVERGAAGQTSRYDTVVRISESARLTIDFQLVPLLDDDGKVTALVPSGLDISDRKRFEEDLAILADIEATQRRRTEDLLRLAEALSAAVDVDEIAAEVAAIGGEAVGAAFTNVALRTDDGNDLVLRHGSRLDPSIKDRWPRIPVDASTPLGACMTDRAPRYVGTPSQIQSEFPLGAADSVAAGFEALAALPTHNGHAAVGFAWHHPVDFTPPLRNVLEVVAQLTGQAIERAAMYERERRVADRLQRSLLPQALTPIPGADLAARYDAGADGLVVGGDWYDVGRLSEDRWVLAVGDLVGRGVTAASAMGQLRSAFSALSTNAKDVRVLVERLDLVAQDIPGARLATMVAIEYDSTSGRLWIVSAGHLPPFIRRADGSVERIDGGGPPLGYEVGLSRQVMSSTIGPGDSLFLYTDGLIERRGSSIDDGLEKLAAVIEEAAASISAAGLCDAVHGRLASGASDDIAMLAMKL